MEKPLDKIVKMAVQCPKCEKKYQIDSSKVTEKGARVTCSNCGYVFIVRKNAKEEKQDLVQCSNCGEPATIHLDTDKPICESCNTLEEEKAARFQAMIEGKEALSRLAGVLSLLSGNGQSFTDLSGGDFSKALSAAGQKPNIVKSDKLDEALYEEILDKLARGGKWQSRDKLKKLFKAGPDSPLGQLAPELKTEEAKLLKAAIVSLVMGIDAETRKPEMKWYSPLILVDWANYGFLFVARSAGKAARFVHTGTIGGLLKIDHALSMGKKEKKSEQPGRTMKIEEGVPTDETPEESLEINLDDFLKEKAPTDKTPEESGSSPPGVTAESDIEGLTREELNGIIDEATKETGIDIRDFIKKLE